MFSGHGDTGCIYAEDSKVSVEQVFNPWMPKYAPHLANIQKLFFLDACRGDVEDKGVSILSTLLNPSGMVAKGGRAPSFGNYLLAYSTMPTMKAFEKPGVGGFWIQHLVKELLNEDNIDRSLTDVLTEVNDKLLKELESERCEHIQQPVLESTLRQNIYLLRDAKLAGWSHDQHDVHKHVLLSIVVLYIPDLVNIMCVAC